MFVCQGDQFREFMLFAVSKRQVEGLHLIDPDVARSHQIKSDAQLSKSLERQVVDSEDVFFPVFMKWNGCVFPNLGETVITGALVDSFQDQT